jgi:Protein of unknown function (DUF1360)
MSFEWLAVGVLCVWRLTHLLAAEDGPWRSIARLRAAVGSGLWGRLLDCFYCLSLWVALPLALLIGTNWAERAALWLALSAGAILLERVTARSLDSAPAPYLEDEDDKDGMLR